MTQYTAFLSYSHRDRQFADWLHRRLESYRMPRRIIGAPGHDGPVPARLFPVFRDRDELPTSPDLGDRIIEALGRSKALIVICSPDAASSRWVNEEILTFRRMGRGDRVLSIIARGEPHAGTDKECFPRALLEAKVAEDEPTRSVEPIAADARPEGDGRENALLKVIAGILGIGFEALRQRELEASRRRTRIAQGIAAAMVLLAIGAGTAGWLALQARGVAVERQQEAEAARSRAEEEAARADRAAARAEREAEAAEAARARAETGFAAARDTADSLVFDLAQGLRNREGMPTALVRDLLDRAGRALDALLARTPDDLATLRLRGAAYIEFATTFATLGDTARQREAAQQAVGIFTRLAERDPGDAQRQRSLSVSHNGIGDVLLAQGDLAGALREYQQGMAIRTRLVERDPGNAQWQRDLFVSRWRLGDIHLRLGEPAEARPYGEAALAQARDRRARFPDQRQTAGDLSAAEALVRRVEAAAK